MKKQLLFTLFLLSASFLGFAQNASDYRLLLRSGAFIPEKNIQEGASRLASLRQVSENQKSFVIIQFDKIPSEEEKSKLKKEGIELLDYVPNYAYTAMITGPLNTSVLSARMARSVVTLTAEQKMQPTLASGIIPEHAVKIQGTVDVWISYPKSFSYSEIRTRLDENKFEVISDIYKSYQIIGLRVSVGRLKELALLPFIQYVQSIPKEDKSFNNKSTVNGRANVLNSTLPGARNLTGSGVVVGVGDESNPLLHIDFNGRIINRAAIEEGSHGLHVMGTIAGGGIKNEKYKGYAPKATILAQNYSKIFTYAPLYVKDNGMVITNNSYGEDINTCETFGEYNLYSYILDRQAFQMPYLQHVFAAGNSGSASCSPYPTSFGNVLSGYQTAKNVISVGNSEQNGEVAASSSRGPVKDGRLKPEITAQGQSVASTIPIDLYGISSGTSMAAPAVSGGLALLYQRYRQLHNNTDPKNALMKALICNGGTDKGNEGPDYKNGFGNLNTLRSVIMLEKGAFANDSLMHQGNKNYTITVPPNTASLKVMLYWNDPAGTIFSTQNLVNDLDLTVSGPGGSVLPRILDSTPSNVNNTAGTGADHVNNMEQVVIYNPAQGSYSIQVNGSLVAQNPYQEYVMVYDVIPVSTTLTYPIGKESLKDGDILNIGWDSFGNSDDTFMVMYSPDNGVNWIDIQANALPSGMRRFDWTIPAGTVTDKARIRVSQNGSGLESVSQAFTILGRPVISQSVIQCEGYITVDWTALTGVTDYEVMILKGTDMVSAGTTTSTSYTIGNLSKDSTYWVSVRGRLNGNPGMRSLGISIKPDKGDCAGSISNNDLKIETIISPALSGRKNTSLELTDNTPVTIRIKNLDDVSFNETILMDCWVNNVPVASGQPFTPVISAGGTVDYTFPSTINLSAVGAYEIKVKLNHISDPYVLNNTITKTFRQLDNPAVSLPFLDDVETLSKQTYSSGQKGFAGGDRYDFSTDSDAGRIRTFVNSGLAFSGNKAFTLDANRFYAPGTSSFLDGTFNLGTFDAASDNVRLDFEYKNHGQQSHPNNRVWIRGSDTGQWIEAYDLFANQNSPDEGYKLASGIEISNLLFANNQQLTASFQVRWGQWGNMLTADSSSGAGYTFDNIKLYLSTNDISVVKINNPSVDNCSLGAEEIISVTIRNSATETITNIPVSYKLGNGIEVHEIIPIIEARTSQIYNFSGKANLSALGPNQIKVWVSLPTDDYNLNDTQQVDFYNSLVINTFPYIQNFETGDGYWHSAGNNSSWFYGTPASTKINKAASGSKAWKTNLSGSYNDKELSFLYSPCFNVNGMNAPTLSFSMALDLEDCDPKICDIAYVEYSGDGSEWIKLGTAGQGTNWYNRTVSGNSFWSAENDTYWHVATSSLPTGFNSLRLRFVLKSDPGVHREGVAIDDIHIYNLTNGIYDETTQQTAITQDVSGSGWVDFVKNSKLIASVNPDNQNLGATDVQAYMYNQAVRFTNEQYYLNRNITIKPTVASPAAPATVRLYILDSEVKALVNATGCNGCIKPLGAYELGISKYTDPAGTTEDGEFLNSKSGSWSFIPSAQIALVPFDKGYYAEIKVADFSEFWFSKNLLGTEQALPVDLISFTAKKKPSVESQTNVLLEWTTSSEKNFHHFEVELAQGNEDYKFNRFVKIADVAGKGSEKASVQKYTFNDRKTGKSGVRYYRLKMIDLDGSYRYSQIRPVVFEDKIEWYVYPNPSDGYFQLVFQANAGTKVTAKIFDLNGRLHLTKKYVASGFVEKQHLDLSKPEFSSGLYMLEVNTDNQKQVFKIIKD